MCKTDKIESDNLKDNEERRTLQGEYVKECIIADKKSENTDGTRKL